MPLIFTWHVAPRAKQVAVCFEAVKVTTNASSFGPRKRLRSSQGSVWVPGEWIDTQDRVGELVCEKGDNLVELSKVMSSWQCPSGPIKR